MFIKNTKVQTVTKFDLHQGHLKFSFALLGHFVSIPEVKHWNNNVRSMTMLATTGLLHGRHETEICQEHSAKMLSNQN